MTTVIQSEEQLMAVKTEQVALVTGASSGIGKQIRKVNRLNGPAKVAEEGARS
jgi:NADP-dependent 3-hydroxy acid dehydrogenase YdfG